MYRGHQRLPFMLEDLGSILGQTSTQGLKIMEYINISNG